MYLNANRTTIPQAARWYDLLQEYEVEIKHRAGEKMAHVDALSCAPEGESTDTWEEITDHRWAFVTITEAEYGQALQRSDEQIQDWIKLWEEIQANPRDNRAGLVKDFGVSAGCLYPIAKEHERERSGY